MKTFDEITRKFFAPDSEGGSEFVVPECWKPKTCFQVAFLNFALSNAGDKIYSEELLAALSQCINDSPNLYPKTYKELLLTNANAIEANKMLPKTPEELAFALLKQVPVEFTEKTPDSVDDGGGK